MTYTTRRNRTYITCRSLCTSLSPGSPTALRLVTVKILRGFIRPSFIPPYPKSYD